MKRITHLELAPDPGPAPSSEEEVLSLDVDQQLDRVVRLPVTKVVERGFLKMKAKTQKVNRERMKLIVYSLESVDKSEIVVLIQHKGACTGYID